MVSVQKVSIPTDKNSTLGRSCIPRKRAQSPFGGKNGAKIESSICVARERAHHARSAVPSMELRLHATADDSAYEPVHLTLPLFRRFGAFEPRVKSSRGDLRRSMSRRGLSVSHDVYKFPVERRQF